jgi:transglutaminase-like putative cysteine protease
MFRRQSLTGFSDTTSLGDIGRIKLDRRKVMEVELSGARPADAELRWRGLALNEFDGRTWTRSHSRYSRHAADGEGRFFPSGGRLNAPPRGRPARANLLTQEIRLEPGATRAMFSAANPRVVVSRDFRRLGEDGFGNLELPAKPTRRLKYNVASELPPRDGAVLRRAAGDDPRQVRARNLALPALDPRIPALAREITANAATRYDAAVAVEQWLSSRLAYSLAVDDRGAADPLARFLFEGMAGHCEYFATAMVVLAREAGIPARFVAGYLRGERSRFGRRYTVRQSDAHSWVEVYFPGIGWVPFDPTPPAGRDVAEAGGLWALATYLQSSMTRLWDDYLVGIDLDDQVRGLLALTNAVNVLSDRLRGLWSAIAAWHPLRIVLLVISSGLLVYLGRRASRRWRLRERRKRTRPRDTTVPTFYAAAVSFLSRNGLSRGPAETPAEFAARAESSLTRHAADRLHELTRLYYRVRFDGVTSERKVARIARALLGDVRAGLRRPEGV